MLSSDLARISKTFRFDLPPLGERCAREGGRNQNRHCWSPRLQSITAIEFEGRWSNYLFCVSASASSARSAFGHADGSAIVAACDLCPEVNGTRPTDANGPIVGSSGQGGPRSRAVSADFDLTPRLQKDRKPRPPFVGVMRSDYPSKGWPLDGA